MSRSIVSIKRLAVATVFAAALPAIAAAQQCVQQPGTLGVAIACDNCGITIWNAGASRRGSGERTSWSWRFPTEPRISGVDRDAPASESLRAGDVIVSIDGHLITTAAGADRFSSLVPGEPVTVVVRRNGELITTRFNATAQPCSTGQQGQRGVQSGQQRPQREQSGQRGQDGQGGQRSQDDQQGGQSVQQRQRTNRDTTYYLRGDLVISSYTPRAAFGFAIACSNCSHAFVDSRDSSAVIAWKFDQQPELYSVEPGSAADRAGMRRGDVITHVDDIVITRPEAGRRFGTVRPGRPMRFTYRRGSSTRTVTVTAQSLTTSGQRAGQTWVASGPVTMRGNVHIADEAGAKAGVQPIRYSGRLGNTDVEVRGGVGVIVTYTDDEIIIVSGDTTVRLRRR